MKFVGSKQRISKDIAPIIQQIIDIYKPDKYIEPFVGGANMIDKIKHTNKYGYDNNYYLIQMWKSLQDGWVIPPRPTKEEYIDVKNNKNMYPPEWVSIVGFVSTYNAKWFDGYANITITKTGVIRDYYNEGVRNIQKQIPNIMDVTFEHQDFNNIKVDNCVIYCDPPYKTQKTRKDLYGNDFEYQSYYNWVREQSKNNVIICSEYQMPSDFVCIYQKGVGLHFDNRQTDSRVERLFIHESNITYCPKCKTFMQPSRIDGYNSYCYQCDEDFGYFWLSKL